MMMWTGKMEERCARTMLEMLVNRPFQGSSRFRLPSDSVIGAIRVSAFHISTFHTLDDGASKTEARFACRGAEIHKVACHGGRVYCESRVPSLGQRSSPFEIGSRHESLDTLIALLERDGPSAIERANDVHHVCGLNCQLVLRDGFECVEYLVDALWHTGIVALVAVELVLVFGTFNVEFVLIHICAAVTMLVEILVMVCG